MCVVACVACSQDALLPREQLKMPTGPAGSFPCQVDAQIDAGDGGLELLELLRHRAGPRQAGARAHRRDRTPPAGRRRGSEFRSRGVTGGANATPTSNIRRFSSS